MVKKEMGKVTEKRIMIVGTSGCLAVVIPYLVCGIIGYISIGEPATE